MYNDYLYPHERLFYQDRLANYHDKTIAAFCRALQAELEYLQSGDYADLFQLKIGLTDIDYYGSYYALWVMGD